MMFSNSQLLYTLAGLSLLLLCPETIAEVVEASVPNNALNTLYENMLQREYAGPVVFPNHQVERKAVRSPSLRLRFGRRSDPDILPSAEKRWFGDVNQKPIRSPSLRLRFGRRSDPSMPLHSSFDALMNDLTNVEENAALEDYNDIYDGYERIVRKPQRLRWGRSVPVYEGAINDYAEEENERAQRQRANELLNSIMNSEKLRNILLTLRQYDSDNGAVNADDDIDDGFSREVRKPAPLRLRFGRSTGGPISMVVADASKGHQALEKKANTQNAPNVQLTGTPQGQKKA